VRRCLALLLLLLIAAPVAAAKPFSPWSAPMRIAFVGPASARAGIVVLHPGAWWLRAPDALAVELPQAQRFAALGLLAADVDYRNGVFGIGDVRRAYDRLARRLPAGAPICVFGESAGGHLGLLLAETRAVACVAARAPVVTPSLLAADGDPATYAFAQAAFANRPDAWAKADVLRRADRLPPTLVTVAQDDPVVSPVQAQRLAAAAPQVSLTVLAPGPARFTHGTADPTALAAATAGETAFVERYAGPSASSAASIAASSRALTSARSPAS
jgi:acetyl esterase/lipase